jgi:hypothetical protein
LYSFYFYFLNKSKVGVSPPASVKKVLWKAKATPSSKFFIWLALLDRCWTRDRLLWHHLKDDGSCPLCSQVEEMIDHLLLGCCYTRALASLASVLPLALLLPGD